jgi:hypothetical protein
VTCILWTGTIAQHGYGRFGKRYAHRIAWEQANGRSLEPGEVVRHSCDVRACVNPDHLHVGTQADNMRDAAVRGRIQGGMPLFPLDLDDVKRRHHAGESFRSIARSYGTTHSVIARRLDPDEAERHRAGKRKHAPRCGVSVKGVE